MKVKDEASWLQQKATLAQSDDAGVGELFMSILDEWTTLAEHLKDQLGHSLKGGALQALRETLPRVVQNHGALSGLWIYEMLIVMDSNWIHGGELYEDLSDFEQASYGDVARSILRNLQEGAEAAAAGSGT